MKDGKYQWAALIVFVIMVIFIIPYSSSGCESGHWVESVSNDGQIVKLEDGSIWEVDAIDRIDSILWLPTTDIIACDDKLINTDDNETVSARRIR